MQPIKHPVERFFIYLILSLFVAYSIIPFLWTMLQSLKTVRQANARTPLIFFTPTFKNYTDLWLESIPDKFPTAILGLLALLVTLALVAIFVKRLPFPSLVEFEYRWRGSVDPVDHPSGGEHRRVLQLFHQLADRCCGYPGGVD